MGRIICVSSPKGGVGKTTTAANLAAALAQRGQRVLLVELDPQGALVPSMGLSDSERPFGINDVLAGKASARQAILPTAIEGLDLLAAMAKNSLDEMELETAAASYPLALREHVDELVPRYDALIVDSAPGVGPLARLALCVADSFLVPVQAEELSLRTLGRQFSLVEEIKRDWNPEIECEGLLLTMVDLRTRMSVRVANTLHENYGDKVFLSMVPRSVGIQEMPLKGKPSVIFAPSSRGSQAYGEVADELLINLVGHNLADASDEIEAEAMLTQAAAQSGASWIN